jgi:phosphoribosyl 1,2-cyclic phosphodiesterase
MRVTSLGSGSTGNAFLVEAGPQRRTKLLVDAGLNWRAFLGRLRQVDVSPAQLQGVLVTHEHSDHIIGLPSLMYYYAIPAIADPHTLEAIEQVFASGMYHTDTDEHLQRVPHYTTPFSVGSCCVIGDIKVRSFPVSHDAAAPCGYLLSAGGCRICIAIDSGEVTATMLEMMSQADLLIIESNHDLQRLLNGPYPYIVKQRILSNLGHLSNDQAAEAVLRTWRTDSIRWIWLSHLSLVNNTPEIALSIMRSHIKFAGANPDQVHLTALPPGIGSVWDSSQLWEMPSLWEMKQ